MPCVPYLLQKLHSDFKLHPVLLAVIYTNVHTSVLLYLLIAIAKQVLLCDTRGPPRPRPVRDGEEDKENQGGEGGQNQQPRSRRYRKNFHYRRRRQQTGGKPGPENKEPKTGGDPSAEKTSAPEAQQGGAE